jgi:hypothetical protein
MSPPILRSSNTLIVTGMHRSGTSLLASALEQAGLSIGDRLLGATPSNPKGHFEDLDFVEWHEAVFADNGRTTFDAHQHGPLEISPQRRREARAMIDARQGRAVWGWKDPRTCLFLEFWHSLLPDARMLMVHRSPEEVLASLDRRRHDELTRRWPGLWSLKRFGVDLTFRRRRAARWWLASNAAMLAFAREHPDRCLVVELARLRDQLPPAIEFMRSAWNLPLSPVDLDAVLDDRLLHGATPVVANSRPRTPIERTIAGLHERSRHGPARSSS